MFAVECHSWLNVARLWGESTRLKHTSSFKPQSDRENEFSTFPGYVFGVHVTFVCRAECFTGVHTCENIVKCPPGSCVWVVTRKETSLMAQAAVGRK